MEQDINPTSDPNIDPRNSNGSISKEITALYLIKNFYWLWIKPNKFFNQVNTNVASFAVGFCAYLMGITTIADRIDINILKAYNGGNANELIMNATTNWINYWGIVLGFGMLAAGIGWLFWGWIYNLRVKWSGDNDFDPTRGRVIYSVSNLVLNLPYLIVIVVPVFFYPDYITYYNHDEFWSSGIVIFTVWVHVTHFIVVKQQFNVVTWKAAIWFLIVPISILLGVITLLIRMVL